MIIEKQGIELEKERFRALRWKIGWITLAVIIVLCLMKSSGEPIFAIYLLPFIAHFGAKAMIRNQKLAAADQQAQQLQQHTQVQQQRTEEQQAEMLRAHEQTTSNNLRSTLIKKLTTVTNYVELLSDPAYQDRITTTKQNIRTELSNIVATYPPAELTPIIQSYPEIQTKLHNLRKSLSRYEIENDDLDSMLKTVEAKK